MEWFERDAFEILAHLGIEASTTCAILGAVSKAVKLGGREALERCASRFAVETCPRLDQTRAQSSPCREDSGFGE